MVGLTVLCLFSATQVIHLVRYYICIIMFKQDLFSLTSSKEILFQYRCLVAQEAHIRIRSQIVNFYKLSCIHTRYI